MFAAIERGRQDPLGTLKPSTFAAIERGRQDPIGKLQPSTFAAIERGRQDGSAALPSTSSPRLRSLRLRSGSSTGSSTGQAPQVPAVQNQMRGQQVLECTKTLKKSEEKSEKSEYQGMRKSMKTRDLTGGGSRKSKRVEKSKSVQEKGLAPGWGIRVYQERS